ncbi:hypothetical protein FT663_00348 [Candidozyma haemuli var. vulneris]|uniref:Zn(2)-C6 fungal-type domain-containing protein n=1 Tax=Candidozyma haemuli TaxID=45357 RepID=A0A2V1AQU6_9ASCO|nr:hypothetical protein CXQ85_002002 [[Candida] haemuloni]KAF3992963.1 hypothetical protein FT662_00786 [[Candida] haemuloni var. vulneris]KAF3995601.1 hypothetical protein FT663_00348 [[Candida] haemuloni var. vulneris]PVH20218.1 hypothetical protein CXQ85_002002 [[Candida] haemuloni]
MVDVKDETSQKLISTKTGLLRVSQACDRCRMKKIKCDGATPCNKCSAIGFECTTSDKLSRRAFPKGYTVNLENRVKELEDEVNSLRVKLGQDPVDGSASQTASPVQSKVQPQQKEASVKEESDKHAYSVTTLKQNNNTIHINNPIDQIFNLGKKGIIIGNDNLNFESQFNHLLINLGLPFLKITNSHNYLLNDPDSYLYHPSYSNYNDFHNKDLDLNYNPLTSAHDAALNSQLPKDVYDLFIKLINNFKKIFNSKKELDHQIIQFFLNYNTFIPIFNYKKFMETYDAFHTMYPFMFTYDDATINGFNLSTYDYHVVNEYLILVIQIYAMIYMNNPSLNLNLLLNHSHPNYSYRFRKDSESSSIIRSLYDFLPYLNVYCVSVEQLQVYLLFFYYSLLTNNKEKSLVLSCLINSFIGILGINLNSRNLFFNDLSLNLHERRTRVKIFWGFKVLLKCFNLKFGFKPSINTTVINPVTIERYFKLTPEKLSTLLEPQPGEEVDPLFETLLKPSVEFLNLMNIIIPSSFSPNYYQYLKQDKQVNDNPNQKKSHPNNLDWILNDDDGDGNDGNLNYNFTQFLTIDKNLSNWRYALEEKRLDLMPLHLQMGLPVLSSIGEDTLYHRVTFDGDNSKKLGLSEEGVVNYLNAGIPDIKTASQLIKMQLNFHYLLIRSSNYLNFVIDRELTQGYYVKIANISREVLAYFILIFEHIGESAEQTDSGFGAGANESSVYNSFFSDPKRMAAGVMSPSLGLDVDEDGFVINDFSVKRRKSSLASGMAGRIKRKEIQASPYNSMLNGLSLTIINFKKSIVLQMLYLLICTLKIAKKGGVMSADTIRVLNRSISLFIKIFINYQPNANKYMKTKKVKEDDLFKRIINDELRDEILKDKRSAEDSDDDDFGEHDIDWDDEDMDEDLKYLKVLKYVKYKTNLLFEKSQQQRRRKQELEKDQRTSQPPPPPQPQQQMHSLSQPMEQQHSNLQPGSTPVHDPTKSSVQLPPIMPLSMGMYQNAQGGSLQYSGPLSPTIYGRQSSISKANGLNNNLYLGEGALKDNEVKNEDVANDLMNLRHGRSFGDQGAGSS